MYGTLRTRKVGYKFLSRPIPVSRPLNYSPFYNFEGGINTSRPSHSIKDNELSDAYNMVYSDWGLKTRLGNEIYNDTEISGAGSIRGLKATYATGSRVILVADNQGEVFKDDGAGDVSTSLKSGLTADSHYDFNDWKQYVIINNGNDEMYKWDGSDYTEIPNAPSGCTGSLTCENRLFAWGKSGASEESYLYFSDLNDEETWDPTTEYSGFLVLPKVQGDKIIGCARQGKTIVVFKSNSIWKYHLYGKPRNWTRELISNSIGCGSQWSIVNVQDVVFFTGNDGRVYMLAETLKLISTKIECPDTTRWGLPTDISRSAISETVGYYNPARKSVIFIYNDASSTTDYPNKYAEYYITRNAWLRGNMNAYHVAVCDGADDDNSIYIGSVDDGYIRRIDTGTNDDSAAIDSYIKTKAVGGDIRTIWNTAYVATKPVGDWNVVLTAYIDFDSSGTNFNMSQVGIGDVWDTPTKWDTAVWGGAGLIRSRVDLGNLAGHYIELRLRTNTADQSFETRGLAFSSQQEVLI